MNTSYTFSDVLIKPKYSTVTSRKDVDLSTSFSWPGHKLNLSLPILSSNMDTITNQKMAIAMAQTGGMGVLHRFQSIEANMTMFGQVKAAGLPCMVSIGLGENELKRAKSLYGCGADLFVIDVAHGAQRAVALQYKRLKEALPSAYIIVGNFATSDSIVEFIADCGYALINDFEGAIKVGIGPGSACSTRIKTGVGVPQLSAIIDCVRLGIPIIADGGLKTPGDIAKALGAGAKAVMLGGMLAGTLETPGEITGSGYKVYRGSASKESYADQGKEWSTAEGESFQVPYRGSVKEILAEISGGLQSSFSYVGASSLQEFQNKVEFIRVSGNTTFENGAHLQ